MPRSRPLFTGFALDYSNQHLDPGAAPLRTRHIGALARSSNFMFSLTYPLPSLPRQPLSDHARAPFALHLQLFIVPPPASDTTPRNICSDPRPCPVFVVTMPPLSNFTITTPLLPLSIVSLACLNYHASTPSLHTFIFLVLRITPFDYSYHELPRWRSPASLFKHTILQSSFVASIPFHHDLRIPL